MRLSINRYDFIFDIQICGFLNVHVGDHRQKTPGMVLSRKNT